MCKPSMDPTIMINKDSTGKFDVKPPSTDKPLSDQLRLQWYRLSPANKKISMFLLGTGLFFSAHSFLGHVASSQCTSKAALGEIFMSAAALKPDLSFFDAAVQESYEKASTRVPRTKPPPPLNLQTWDKRSSGAQLLDSDRLKLAELYSKADSVFEYGLGESTHIAAHVNVPRFSGIDSDAHWLSIARDGAPDHFRFYFADIGTTRDSGFALNPNLNKNVYDYQVAPLDSEREAFDVYFVDARWRAGCAILCFLHASARGGDRAKTRVLIHDYLNPDLKTAVQHIKRRRYAMVEQIADLVESPDDGLLAVFKRKPGVTDEQLWKLWHEANTDPLIPVFDRADQ